MYEEENLTRSIAGRILSAATMVLLIGIGIAIKDEIIDIRVLVEAWSGHALSVFTVWWAYAGVGIYVGIYAFIPSKYKTVRLYENWLELAKNETTTILFQDIFKLIRNKRSVKITLKNGTRVTFECRKKSAFPYLLESEYLFWKYGSEDN